MEYSPVNLSLKNEPQGAYFTPTLGAYDYWGHRIRLQADRARAGESRTGPHCGPARVNLSSPSPPTKTSRSRSTRWSIRWISETTRWASTKRRVKLSQELWLRLEQRQLPEGDSYSVLRRRFLTGFVQLGSAMGLAAKYVGGSELTNDTAGSGGCRSRP